MLTFRTAQKTPGDVSVLTEFIGGLWSDAKAWTPRALLGEEGAITPSDYVIHHLLAAEESHVVIACQGACDVGMGYLAVTGGNSAKMIDIYVAPNHRDAGVGSNIIEHLESVASKKGIAFLDIEVANGNRAQELYSRCGYQPFTRTMRKSLQLPYRPELACESMAFSVPDVSMARAAYEMHAAELRAILPFASIEHIGASSIPGAMSKGDLDIGIGVKSEYFMATRALLSERYERNLTSTYSDAFASFKNDRATPPLGIQLYVQGGQYDMFTQFRNALASNPDMVVKYNALKESCEGMPMGRYRQIKSKFIESVLANSRAASQQGGPADGSAAADL